MTNDDKLNIRHTHVQEEATPIKGVSVERKHDYYSPPEGFAQALEERFGISVPGVVADYNFDGSSPEQVQSWLSHELKRVKNGQISEEAFMPILEGQLGAIFKRNPYMGERFDDVRGDFGKVVVLILGMVSKMNPDDIEYFLTVERSNNWPETQIERMKNIGYSVGEEMEWVVSPSTLERIEQALVSRGLLKTHPQDAVAKQEERLDSGKIWLDEYLSGVWLDDDGNMEMDEVRKAQQGTLNWLLDINTDSSAAVPEWHQPTLPIMKEIELNLGYMGIKNVAVVENNHETFGKQGALALRIGPDVEGGILIAPHIDTVPAGDMEEWQTDPRRAVLAEDDNFYGRGVLDLKGALANALITASVLELESELMTKPFYVAISWGEELGAKGVPDALEALKKLKARPEVTLIPEPTGDTIAKTHKAILDYDVQFTGIGGHAGNPDSGVNAANRAAEMQLFLEGLAAELKQETNADFDPPHGTLNVGFVRAGTAGNAIPEKAQLQFEVRTISPEQEQEVAARIDVKITELDAKMKAEAAGVVEHFPQRDKAAEKVGIDFSKEVMPGLYSQEIDAEKMEAIMGALSNGSKRSVEEDKVMYGTDAGAYSKDPQIGQSAIVIYHPGDMIAGNAHKPNEHISRADLEAGLGAMVAVAERFTGIEKAKEEFKANQRIGPKPSAYEKKDHPNIAKMQGGDVPGGGAG